MRHYTIGIDPGTACGWAVLDFEGARLASGAWNLQGRRYEGGGMRFVRFERLLTELIEAYEAFEPVHVAYEEVRRHRGVDAAHVYGGLVATLQRVCELREVPYTGVPVGTVKKVATGKGNANKRAMLNSALIHWKPGIREFDRWTHDEADALWIAETHRRGLS